MKVIQQDEHFVDFIDKLEDIIAGHGGKNDAERQKAQVERLVDLEIQFRRALIRHPWGKGVYKDFVRYIMHERKNILEARPFFRERNTAFTGYEENGKKVHGIADFLRNYWDAEKQEATGYRGFYRFNINYNFVAFVINSRKWDKNPWGRKVTKLADEIVKQRDELVEINMPLAISRAKMFSRKVQESHLSYMDFIQISAEGLLAAIDKYCLPYSTVFRTVAAHRIVGNLIDNFSETSMHFYPKDRRRLYQAYKYIKICNRAGKDYDIDELVASINKTLRPSEQTTSQEMISLLKAATVMSADGVVVSDPDDETGAPVSAVDRYSAPESCRPDVQVEDYEVRQELGSAIARLSVFERKFLRLRGIEIAS